MAQKTTYYCDVTGKEVDEDEATFVSLSRLDKSHSIPQYQRVVLSQSVLDKWDVERTVPEPEGRVTWTGLLGDTERVWLMERNTERNYPTRHGPDSDDETAVALMELLNNEVLDDE